MLLLRRKPVPARDHEARVLRGLWPRLGPVTLVEFKGPTAGFRPTDLLTLLGYGVQYHKLEMKKAIERPSDLTMVLITPTETSVLTEAIDHMESWRLERLDDGYARVVGAWYNTIIAFTDEVCEAERDDYLRLFSRRRPHSVTAMQWLNKHFLRMTTMENAHELEGYDELVTRLLEVLTPEQRVRGLLPEELLAGVDSDELLAALTPEQRVRGLLPDELLAGVDSDELLAGVDSDELLAALTPEQRVRGLQPEELLAALTPEQRIRGLQPDELLAGLGPEKRAVLRRLLDESE